MLSTSLLVQPETPEALENLAFEYLGPFSVLQSGVNIVDKQLPNIGQNAIPVLQDMTEQLQRRAGAYSAPSGNPNPKERTKFEVQAQLQGDARLTTGAMNLFYEPWTRLLRGCFKRATREDYLSAESGGRQVAAFWKYCTERGVPLDALHNKIEEVNAVRAIGAGSDQLRLVAMDEMMQMLGQFDEQGKQNVLRDRLAVRVGYDQVDRYVPKQPDSRPVIDQKIAELENAAMAQGKQIQVSPGENHFVHAQVHITDIAQQAEALKQQQVDPQQAVAYFQSIAPHANQHLQQVAQDASRKQEYGQLKKTFQQAGEIFQQTSEKVQAQQAEQAQQAPQQAGPSEEQYKLQMEQERHQQKMALQAAEAKQKLALRDAEMAQKIRSQSA
jgi:hypothetical protein